MAKFQVLFNLATCSSYLITCYIKTPVFHFYEKMNKRQLKCQLLKMVRSPHTVISIIIKWPGFSFQSPALSQKYVRNVFSYSTLVFDQIPFWWYLGFKRNKHKFNSHYMARPMMMSKVLNFVNFSKTQKSRYLKNETLFFLQIKKFINYTPRATLWQKIVL